LFGIDLLIYERPSSLIKGVYNCQFGLLDSPHFKSNR